MSYIRRDKLKRTPKEIKGDQKVITPEEIQEKALRKEVPVDQIDALAEDLAILGVLEDLEDELTALEDEVDDKLKDFKIELDPEGAGSPEGPTVTGIGQMGILEALKNLNDGTPTSTLDEELLKRAMDITVDSQTHMSGFDILSVLLGDYGSKEGVPLAPTKPTKIYSDRLTCSEQQVLKNIPDIDEVDGSNPTTEPLTMEKITDIFEKQKRMTLFDLILKLVDLLFYYVWKMPYDFLKKLQRRPIKRVIKKVRKFCKKKMDYYWCRLTGECADDLDIDVDIEDSIIDPIDEESVFSGDGFLEGKGINCVESAGVVMDYLNKNKPHDTTLIAYSRATERRQEVEAVKHGELTNIKNKELLRERIEELDSKTKDSPRFRRRYYGKRKKDYPWTA